MITERVTTQQYKSAAVIQWAVNKQVGSEGMKPTHKKAQ